MESDTTYVAFVVLGGVFALCIVVGVLVYLKRCHNRQTFTKPGFGYEHLGFHAEQPSDYVYRLLRDQKPSFVLKVADWKHVGFDVTKDVCCVVGIDPFDNVTYMGGAFRAAEKQTVRIIGRTPHREREYDGSFTIAFDEDAESVLHFWCPFYRFYQSVRLPAKGTARLCLFPYFVRHFLSKGQIEKFPLLYPGGKEIALTGVSSCLLSVREQFPGHAEAAMTSVYAAGEVQSCVKRVNKITGKRYCVVAIDTGPAILELVVRRRAFIRLPRKGEYVACNAELTGYFEECTPIDLPP